MSMLELDFFFMWNLGILMENPNLLDFFFVSSSSVSWSPVSPVSNSTLGCLTSMSNWALGSSTLASGLERSTEGMAILMPLPSSSSSLLVSESESALTRALSPCNLGNLMPNLELFFLALTFRSASTLASTSIAMPPFFFFFFFSFSSSESLSSEWVFKLNLGASNWILASTGFTSGMLTLTASTMSTLGALTSISALGEPNFGILMLKRFFFLSLSSSESLSSECVFRLNLGASNWRLASIGFTSGTLTLTASTTSTLGALTSISALGEPNFGILMLNFFFFLPPSSVSSSSDEEDESLVSTFTSTLGNLTSCSTEASTSGTVALPPILGSLKPNLCFVLTSGFSMSPLTSSWTDGTSTSAETSGTLACGLFMPNFIFPNFIFFLPPPSSSSLRALTWGKSIWALGTSTATLMDSLASTWPLPPMWNLGIEKPILGFLTSTEAEGSSTSGADALSAGGWTSMEAEGIFTSTSTSGIWAVTVGAFASIETSAFFFKLNFGILNSNPALAPSFFNLGSTSKLTSGNATSTSGAAKLTPTSGVSTLAVLLPPNFGNLMWKPDLTALFTSMETSGFGMSWLMETSGRPGGLISTSRLADAVGRVTSMLGSLSLISDETTGAETLNEGASMSTSAAPPMEIGGSVKLGVFKSPPIWTSGALIFNDLLLFFFFFFPSSSSLSLSSDESDCILSTSTLRLGTPMSRLPSIGLTSGTSTATLGALTSISALGEPNFGILMLNFFFFLPPSSVSSSSDEEDESLVSTFTSTLGNLTSCSTEASTSGTVALPPILGNLKPNLLFPLTSGFSMLTSSWAEGISTSAEMSGTLIWASAFPIFGILPNLCFFLPPPSSSSLRADNWGKSICALGKSTATLTDSLDSTWLFPPPMLNFGIEKPILGFLTSTDAVGTSTSGTETPSGWTSRVASGSFTSTSGIWALTVGAFASIAISGFFFKLNFGILNSNPALAPSFFNLGSTSKLTSGKATSTSGAAMLTPSSGVSTFGDLTLPPNFGNLRWKPDLTPLCTSMDTSAFGMSWPTATSGRAGVLISTLRFAAGTSILGWLIAGSLSFSSDKLTDGAETLTEGASMFILTSVSIVAAAAGNSGMSIATLPALGKLMLAEPSGTSISTASSEALGTWISTLGRLSSASGTSSPVGSCVMPKSALLVLPLNLKSGKTLIANLDIFEVFASTVSEASGGATLISPASNTTLAATGFVVPVFILTSGNSISMLAFPNNFDFAKLPPNWPVKLGIRMSARTVMSARPTYFEKNKNRIRHMESNVGRNRQCAKVVVYIAILAGIAQV